MHGGYNNVPTVDQPLRSTVCIDTIHCSGPMRYIVPTTSESTIKVLFTLNKVYSDTQPISKLSVRNGGFLRRIIHTNGNALTNFLGAFGKYSAPSSFSFQVVGAGSPSLFFCRLLLRRILLLLYHTDLIYYVYHIYIYLYAPAPRKSPLML